MYIIMYYAGKYTFIKMVLDVTQIQNDLLKSQCNYHLILQIYL